MRIRVLRLGIVVAFALGMVGLVGVAGALSGPSQKRADLSRLSGDPQVGWVASDREGGFVVISYPLPGISARRIITDPGINSPLALAQNGREVIVTGHFGCTAGEDYEIQTSVTQSSTGALAKGKIQGRCSGRNDQFEAATWVYDEALFQRGTAQACAMLMTRAKSKITDVFQWCRKEDADLLAAGSSY